MIQNRSPRKPVGGHDNPSGLALLVVGDCWEWQGARLPSGYGRYDAPGKIPWTAHRFAWTDRNGPIPPGMLVCHRCDNPPCVRLDHLFLGTTKDNARDMSSKGRGPGQKVSRQQSDEICALYVSGSVRQRDLALRFDIDQATICRIIRGRRHSIGEHARIESPLPAGSDVAKELLYTRCPECQLFAVLVSASDVSDALYLGICRGIFGGDR